ncbi:hypothetical protein ACT5AM_002889 [Cronobacter malonaticus]
MSESWAVPFPESESEHNGLPVYWKYFETIDHDGIKVISQQFIAFHQTEHYAWLAPANWFKMYNAERDAQRWLEEWKKKTNRYAIKKVAKSAERSYAFPTKTAALESLKRRKKYHLMRLRQDISVIETVVKELEKLQLDSPQLSYDFGHNKETETWIFD